jgi:hypothetical protein
MMPKKYFFHNAVLCVFFMIAGLPHPALSVEPVNYDLDISRLKKEIAQVRTERQRLQEDISRDKNEFTSYQERTASRKQGYAAETDSIRGLIVSFERKKDSLDAFIGSLEQKKRNFDLLKERFREHIAEACEKLVNAIKKYPPAVFRPANGALTFLLNDCAAKNIDNREALQRFVQILRNLDESTLSIQTGQEASPVPAIKGNASMLRIGSIFEAVVDEDGKNAAVWQGGEAGTPGWRVLSDVESAGQISKAIAIRESKSMPAFIVLPWGKERPKETGK